MKLTYQTEGTRAFLLEEDGTPVCEILTTGGRTSASVAAGIVREFNKESKSASHTPGPWHVDYEGGGAMGPRALLKNKNGICVGYLYEAETKDENLIAAAPDMHALLKMAVARLGLEEAPPLLGAWFEEAQQLLARIE